MPLYVGEPGQVERAYGLLVSDNYFSALGLRPALGRFFRPDEVARPGGEPVVGDLARVLAEPLRGCADRRRADRSRQRPRPDDRRRRPAGFQGTVLRLKFDLWLPATHGAGVAATDRASWMQRGVRGYTATGLLRPGTTREQAQSDVDGVMRQLAQAVSRRPTRRCRPRCCRSGSSPRGPQRFLVTALAFLQAIMLLLLVAVCGNTANLMLARASARQREMGMRLALGAGPGASCACCSPRTWCSRLLGAALGVAIAVWGTRALAAVPLTIGLPVNFETHVDLGGLVFATALGLACGAIFGGRAGAAARAARSAAGVPRRRDRPGGRSRLRNALMAVQVALALMVLVAAGTLSPQLPRDARHRSRLPPRRRAARGLRPDRPQYRRWLRADCSRAGFSSGCGRCRRSTASRSPRPFRSTSTDCRRASSRVDGCARADAGFDQALANTVTPGYFAVMGIPLVAGTDFADLRDDVDAAAGHRQRGVRAALSRHGSSRSAAACRRAAGRT